MWEFKSGSLGGSGVWADCASRRVTSHHQTAACTSAGTWKSPARPGCMFRKTFDARCMASELRRRVVPTAAAEPAAGGSAEPDETDRPWYSSLSVRVVLFVLGLFALMHLVLWKWVYEFMRGTNQECVRTIPSHQRPPATDNTLVRRGFDRVAGGCSTPSSRRVPCCTACSTTCRVRCDAGMHIAAGAQPSIWRPSSFAGFGYRLSAREKRRPDGRVLRRRREGGR